MCGIIYIKREDGQAAHKMVAKRYSWQKTRGQKGYGFVSINNGKWEQHWRMEDEARALKELATMKGNEILFHHRNPTSTPNFYEAAHPIFVSNKCLKYDYYVVHNGVITKPELLKEKHDKIGFEYVSLLKKVWVSKTREQDIEEQFNDSEALAVEFALDIEGERAGLGHVDGRIAFMAMQVRKQDNKPMALFWGRNGGSPLMYRKEEAFTSITSEGTGTEVPVHKLFCYDYELKTTSEEDYKVGFHYEYPAAKAASSDYDYMTDWDYVNKCWKKKTNMGFEPNKTLPLPVPPVTQSPTEEQWEQDAEKYEQLKAQKTQLEKELDENFELNDTQEEYILNRIRQLNSEIGALGGKYISHMH